MKQEHDIPKILIVDDVATNIFLLKNVYKKMGVEIFTAMNGYEAIEHSKKNRFALILLDILMPGISGYDALVEIKKTKQNKDTPVFIVTGLESDEKILLDAYKAGAVDFIEKPINLNVLQRKSKYFIDFFIQKQKLNEAINKTEKLMKSRMSLIANITHELRTPLFAMIGMIDLLKKDVQDKTVLKTIEKLEKNSEHLLDTVNDFLDFSKAEVENKTIEYEYFSIKKMLQDVNDIMQFQINSTKVVLNLVVDQTIPEFIRADKKKIRHIVINLVSNALKFTANGEVKVILNDIGMKNGKPILKISVVDSGVGIPENMLDNIFNEYVQVEGNVSLKGAGTGLGLAICKKLVDVLGGTLKVKSKQNEGSTFSFSIPYEFGDQSVLNEVKESRSLEELLKGKEVSILIVDDVSDNLFVLKNYLNTNAIKLDLMSDPHEALELLKLKEFDMAFIDLNMPEMDGYQLADHYRKENSKKHKTPLIALTAFNLDDSLNTKLKKFGFQNYLMKPVKKDFLYKMVVQYAHELSGDDIIVSAIVDKSVSSEDFNLSGLDKDFYEYMPTYLANKKSELLQLQSFISEENRDDSVQICHKILGTAKSFGLFKLDTLVLRTQKELKENPVFDKKILLEYVDEAILFLDQVSVYLSENIRK